MHYDKAELQQIFANYCSLIIIYTVFDKFLTGIPISPLAPFSPFGPGNPYLKKWEILK